MLEQAIYLWKQLLDGWTVPAVEVERTFDAVVESYSGPGRFYHTLDHVMDVLATIDRLRSHAINLHTVKLAAWLHDVIYDSKASDNEERSAQYAMQLYQELGIPEGRRVADLIRRTKTHDAGDDADAKVLIDADLAILGASEVVYRDYAEKIRQEYAWVPDEKYRDGRRQVLKSFLSRARIYHFLIELEEPARRNMADEFARLGTL